MAYQVDHFKHERIAVYRGLSTDTKPTETTHPALRVGDELIETDTGDKYEYRGSTAGWVNTERGAGVANDREMGAVASRTSATWTEAEGVTRIIITAIGDDGVAANESCVVCFDAPDDATAVTWLAGNVDADGATMRRVITVGQPREFTFANPLRRIDAIDLIGTVTNLFIEAGK